MTYFLTLEDVTELGIALMAEEGAVLLIADAGLLDSVLMRPQASVFGKPAYPALAVQAAALLQSLARNHAMVDDDKRMAWAATTLFPRFNSLALRAPSPDVGDRFILDVVDGSLAVPEIGERLTSWSTPT